MKPHFVRRGQVSLSGNEFRSLVGRPTRAQKKDRKCAEASPNSFAIHLTNRHVFACGPYIGRTSAMGEQHEGKGDKTGDRLHPENRPLGGEAANHARYDDT